MTKSKKMKRNSGEAVEVGEPGPSEPSRKIAHPENRDDCDSEEEIYNDIAETAEGGMRIGDIFISPPPKPALTFDATGPRMIITHIVNENFKSYAGTQYLGPFHKSFTSIIGPNGSGKSNVIDSMLFVFGYRASKIRSKKISVLIHSSSRYPNVRSATVSVHFCQILDEQGENFTVIPDSEVVVSRTAFKDNSSHYTLDGRRVQFKDVAVVLRDRCGIDLDHNRFLILQGEVEQIAMMKPKAMTEHEFGMLEYLEDIIGTSRYKEPIEKISERVEQLSESRKEKLNRVRLVESDKAKLEQPMKEAVECMNLTNQALRTRHMMLQKYCYEVGKLIKTRQETLAAIKAKQAIVDAKYDDATKALNEKTAVLEEGSRKFTLLNKEKDNLAEQLDSCKKNMNTIVSDSNEANKLKKNLGPRLEKVKRKLIEFELIPDKNTREIQDCEQLMLKTEETMRKAKEEYETASAEVRTKTEGFQAIKDRVQAKQMPLSKLVTDAKKSFKMAESALDLYMSTEQIETEKLNNMKNSYEEANRVLQEKIRIKEELSSTLPENKRKLDQLRSQLNNIKREESEVLEESVPLMSQVEQGRQAMSDRKSRGRVLDALMREKQNGKLPGIFGRLGDLGGIDLKYDVAVSTCCGALDNIVVDTVETAQACVEFLKQTNIGRATFIALEKQTHLKKDYEKKQNFPENVPRMFDLIKVKDQRVLPAFYYALRDTLVADNLEQATRIAYGRTRYRVVSLNGELIEIAGTMSGGGRNTMRGRMSTSVQEDTSEQGPLALQQNEERLATLQQRLSILRSQQDTMERNMKTLMSTVQEDQKNLEMASTELKNLSEQVPMMKNKIKKQERVVATSRVEEGRKAQLESALAEATERLDKATHDYGEIEKEVFEVDAQISAVRGGRVKELEKKVADLKKKINNINAEIKKLDLAITASRRNANISRNEIARMETEYEEVVKSLEVLSDKKNQVTLKTSKLTKDIEEIDEKINEGSGEYKGLKKEISELESKRNKIKSERFVVANELSAEQKAIKECEDKLPVWETEMNGLQLEDAGEDENGITIPDLEVPAPFATYAGEDLDEVNIEELRAKYKMLKQRLGDVKPNIDAIKAYRSKEATYLDRVAALERVTNSRNALRSSYDLVRKKRQTDFLAGFNMITAKLKEMYQMITLGGDAELELVDSLDPFTEGIIFSVRPPNKSWKNISNLSGGEKTLSSLALVFALHYYRPTPLYVMDEIDAALDFKNVSIVANYIKDRTRNAQFVIISLRYIMFETSNRLVGIYKVRDCTYSVTVENQPILEEPTKSRDKIV